jgi:hypothetical protein
MLRCRHIWLHFDLASFLRFAAFSRCISLMATNFNRNNSDFMSMVAFLS